MKIEYIVEVKNKENISFLEEAGEVFYVARLSNLIVFKATEEIALKLSDHPEVLSIRESRTFILCNNSSQ